MLKFRKNAKTFKNCRSLCGSSRDSFIIKNVFICRIESVVSKEFNFVKFFKEGKKVKRKKTPHVGTLHQCLDWILVADLDKKYCLHRIMTYYHYLFQFSQKGDTD